MTTFKFTIQMTATAAERQALDDRLERYNAQQTGIGDDQIIGIAVHDGDGHLRKQLRHDD